MRKPTLKGKRTIIRHREFYYPTNETWYPNFPRDTVRVHVWETIFGDSNTALIRICVWGADDHGLEKDFYVPIAEKDAKIKELCKFADNLPNPLTHDWLYKQGFVHA